MCARVNTRFLIFYGCEMNEKHILSDSTINARGMRYVFRFRLLPMTAAKQAFFEATRGNQTLCKRKAGFFTNMKPYVSPFIDASDCMWVLHDDVDAARTCSYPQIKHVLALGRTIYEDASVFVKALCATEHGAPGDGKRLFHAMCSHAGALGLRVLELHPHEHELIAMYSTRYGMRCAHDKSTRMTICSIALPRGVTTFLPQETSIIIP